MIKKILPFMALAYLPGYANNPQKTGADDPRPPALLGVVTAPDPRGARIHKVLPDSSASRAGLSVGDIILSVENRPTRSPQELQTEIRRYFAGFVVAVEYERGGKVQTIKIPLGVRRDTASLIGRPAPRIVLPGFTDSNIYTPPQGKVYIIDFWATWCGPCEAVRHELETFKHGGKNAGVEIVGITSEDAATIAAFYKGKKPPYKILIDAGNEVTMAYHVQGYPTLAVIDRQGVVRFAGFASGGGLEKALELAQQLNQEK